MKKINLRIAGVVLLSGMLLQSCKKDLDIPARAQLDAAVALTTKQGIEAAINSAYAVLKVERLYGRDQFSVGDAMADIAFANQRSSRLVSENRNQSLANFANWGTSYNAINDINLTLEAIPAVAATATEKARYEGELKFLRALYYFDLARNYAYIPTFVVAAQDKGGVVITTKGFNSGTAAAEYRPARATLAETYAQIMSDIYGAVSLLANNGRGGATAVNYASKHAALALGSRVALYEGKWQRADSFATAAITLTSPIGSMTNTTNYVAGWRAADHPEAIFQIVYSTLGENIGVNTSLHATHTTLAAPGALNGTRTGQGDLVPNAFLLTELGVSGFPTTLVSTTATTLTYGSDIRNRLFEWGVNSGGRYIEVTKWIGKNGSAMWDNSVVIRWPELYLNRAEARYHLNNPGGAWTDLNTIRTARYVGFTAPTTPLTGQALLDEILRQRMLEFAFEGHRFYDLKRYGTTITKTLPTITLPATDFRLLPRIPTGEIDGNPNMVQNFGY